MLARGFFTVGSCTYGTSLLALAGCRELGGGEMLDADLLHRLYDKLWSYFVDSHLLGQPALVMAGGLILLAAECLFKKWEDTTFYRVFVKRSTSAKIDVLFHLLQFTGLAFFLEVAFTFGVSLGAVKLSNIASDYFGWARVTLPSNNIFEILFSSIIYWLAFHLVGYWVHRIWHTRVFWHVHRFHHSAPEMNYLTIFRIHPAETMVRIFFFISPMILLEASKTILLISLVVNTALNYILHSDLEWDFGWVGRWLIGSPAVHRLHHSMDAEHQNKNFSNCPLWDRVFGTWYEGDKKPSAYGVSTNGVPDRGYDEQPVRQFAHDLLAFYRDLVAGILWPFRAARSRACASTAGEAAPAGSIATAPSADERIRA
jgi:sterol desaturase/sphingolipid hydroxylase (fatty acid hydroxylase superfamily)